MLLLIYLQSFRPLARCVNRAAKENPPLGKINGQVLKKSFARSLKAIRVCIYLFFRLRIILMKDPWAHKRFGAPREIAGRSITCLGKAAHICIYT